MEDRPAACACRVSTAPRITRSMYWRCCGRMAQLSDQNSIGYFYHRNSPLSRENRSSPAVQTAILALQRGPAPFDRAVPTPRPGTPCWRLAEGCQGFPRRPCPRAFRCVGRIVCGSPQFSGHGLACCYASAAEAIKLGDTHVNGRSNIITASSNPSDFKKAHRFTFR